MPSHTNANINLWAKITGASLLIMTLAASYGYEFSLNQLHVAGNQTQSIANIDTLPFVFYSGLAAWLVVLACDLIASYGTYQIFKELASPLAAIIGITRLMYSLFLAVAIGFLATKNSALFLQLFNSGLIVFGFHLLMMGRAAIGQRAMPKAIALLLIAAGIGYVVVHAAEVLLLHDNAITQHLENIFMLPMMTSELILAIWLLLKGFSSRRS